MRRTGTRTLLSTAPQPPRQGCRWRSCRSGARADASSASHCLRCCFRLLCGVPCPCRCRPPGAPGTQGPGHPHAPLPRCPCPTAHVPVCAPAEILVQKLLGKPSPPAPCAKSFLSHGSGQGARRVAAHDSGWVTARGFARRRLSTLGKQGLAASAAGPIAAGGAAPAIRLGPASAQRHGSGVCLFPARRRSPSWRVPS